MMINVRDKLNNAQVQLQGGTGPAARRQITKLKTMDAIARDSEPLFGGTNNPLQALIDLFKRSAGKRRQLQELGDKLTLKAKAMRDANKATFAEMQEVLFAANDKQVDATERNENKHISKKGERDAGRRHHLPLLRARYDALPQEYQDLYKEIVDHHTDQNNRRIELTVRNIIQESIDKYNVTMPAGEDLDSATQWVLSGEIDNVALPMNARNTAMHAALGKTAAHLAAVKDFRAIQGNYVPKVRYGKYYFSARHKVDVPQGASLDPNVADKNVLIFKRVGDLHAWEQSTDETYSQPKIRWVDPTTNATTQKQAMYVGAQGQLVIPEKRFIVTVQNKTVIMNDSRGKLQQTYNEYAGNPKYEMRDIREVDHDTAGLNSEMSPAVQALIHHVEQSQGGSVGTNNVGKQAIVNAIRDAHIRQMTASSATKRRLKRKDVLGYEEDLVKTTMTTSRTMAGHLAGLEQARDLYKADAAVKKYVNDHANDGQSWRRETLSNEVARRIKALSTRNTDGFGNAAIDNILKIVHLAYLATPSYYINNATQPFTTSLPAMGAKYGVFRAARKMQASLRDMGALRNIGKGFTETGRSFKTNIDPRKERYVPRETFGQAVIRRMRSKGVADVNEIEVLWNELELLGAGSAGGHEIAAAGAVGKEGLGGRLSEGLDRVNDITRVMSESVETVNRMTVALPVYRMEREDGKSVEDALRAAISATEMTQGNYSDANNPLLLSSTLGRPVLTFKRYAVMYANMYYEAASKVLTPGQRAEGGKQLALLSLSTIVFAGMTGLPIAEWGMAGLLAANLLGFTEVDWEDVEQGVQDMMATVIGGDMAEAMNRGFTRLLGIDTSNRLGNSSLILFGEPKAMTKKVSWNTWSTISRVPASACCAISTRLSTRASGKNCLCRSLPATPSRRTDKARRAPSTSAAGRWHRSGALLTLPGR